MDRKGKQKLKRYFIVYVIFAVFFTVGMYLITKYEENAKATQIALLLAEHPELEGEIVAIWEKSGTVDFIRDRDDQKIERVVQMLEETYGYHSGSGSSDVVIRIIWGIGLLVGVIVCSLFLYLDRRKNWSRYGDEEQLQQLYECLQEFRKGKFQTYPEETSESEQWLKVWESVKELGQYFEDLKERLEQEENGTKSLITDISHQLKTPLASLRMSHELVAENRVTGEEQREFLEQESQELTKLEQLLNELVNLSRLETHMIQIHSLHESLKKTLTEAVSQIYMKARGKDISIQVEMDDDIVVNHDSKWTVEALTNILENAVKYSPEHTTITVRTQELASNVLIEVEDEGMGIPAEELHKMRMAAKVSEIEAMRYQGGSKRQKSSRKGYQFLNIGRLTKRNLAENKKKSTITIVSMAVTGIFVMMVATVLSCANPMESAKSSIVGQYEISPIVESGNKEHPEYEWAEVQKNNPLNEGLKQQIEELDGVERVDVFTALKVSGGPFEEKIGTEFINGVPEEYAEELKKGITEGNVTYEELKSGDKVILDRALLHWYPDIKVGDKLKLNIHDGDNTFQKEIEVAAIGEYGTGLTNYNCLIMAKEGAEKLTINNSSSYFQVIADKDYDEALEASLQAIVDGSGRLQMRTWKNEYDTWENAIQMTRGACYAFIIILAAISIMNLINTMINSVHVRKKELGMMQAIGMSDRQLMKMLQLEGIFYTVGTLIISIGVGSLAGYPLFLYAKRTGMFDISTYHYPVTAAIIIILTLFVIQMLLAIFIAKSVRKDSLIERIRFSE